MTKKNFWYRAFDLYYDGFRNMQLGKTLWLIIAIKLFVIFFVLKLFFFPDFLKTHSQKGEEPDYIVKEFVERSE
jgi:hypothetical protein